MINSVRHSERLRRIHSALLKERSIREHFYLNLDAESSHFIRLNGSKVRQAGEVEDASLSIQLHHESSPGQIQSLRRSIHLPLDDGDALTSALAAFREMQAEIRNLPIDAYAILPEQSKTPTSETENRGRLLDPRESVEALIAPLERLDLAGIYASGSVFRAMADTAGNFHSFETDTFSFDYSIYTKNERAIKSSYAGTHWSQDAFRNSIASAREKLPALERPAIQMPRGHHRTYLAPAAVSALIQMFSWGCVSERAIRQGDSPLRLVRSGEKKFSPLFTLEDDFTSGDVPRFNSQGQLSPEKIGIIASGRLAETLICSRTAKEYGLQSNAASSSETLRAPSMRGGSLEDSRVYNTLDEGLYVSNLHYLNWSDQRHGRITGMTRYACFYVQNGKLVAPIENLRFDDTIFSLLGDALEALTTHRETDPETSTYGARQLGASRTPGMLLKEMAFTL